MGEPAVHGLRGCVSSLDLEEKVVYIFVMAVFGPRILEDPPKARSAGAGGRWCTF